MVERSSKRLLAQPQAYVLRGNSQIRDLLKTDFPVCEQCPNSCRPTGEVLTVQDGWNEGRRRTRPVATMLRRSVDLVGDAEDPCCTRLLVTKIFF